MLLVLCDTSDVGALWAGLGLRSQCPGVEIVSTEELGSALRFDLRLDGNHRSVRIDLADGRTISSDRLSGVLNRLQQVPAAQIARAAGSERSYAQAEFEALHVSWLAALECPVVNRPRPHGLCGAYRSNLEWALLAARAGFPVDPDLGTANDLVSVDGPDFLGHGRPGSQQSLLVIDDEVTGSPVSPSLADAARSLRSMCEERVIGINLKLTPQGPRFVSATAVPDFRIGGSAAIGALARSLQSKANNDNPGGLTDRQKRAEAGPQRLVDA